MVPALVFQPLPTQTCKYRQQQRRCAGKIEEMQLRLSALLLSTTSPMAIVLTSGWLLLPCKSWLCCRETRPCSVTCMARNPSAGQYCMSALGDIHRMYSDVMLVERDAKIQVRYLLISLAGQRRRFRVAISPERDETTFWERPYV